MPREYTNMLLELVDEGMYSARHVLGVALQCMSEAEVRSMCEDDYPEVVYKLGFEEEEDDEMLPEPVDVSEMLRALNDAGHACFAPGTYSDPDLSDCKWPLVLLVTHSEDGVEWARATNSMIVKVDGLLKPLGWELGEPVSWPGTPLHSRRRETVWTIVPLN